jgi:hypothetical protein
LDLIEKCRNLYKLIDYVHDRRKIVPLRDISREPLKCILDALFYKLKADNFRYIYECLSGNNGLLYGDTTLKSFEKEIQMKINN